MNQAEIEKYMQDNEEKIKQWISWADYYIGFSGVGTTAIDIKPDFPMPEDIPAEVVTELKEGGKIWAKAKWQAWCNAVSEIDDYAIPDNWTCPSFLQE